ncbi:protein phosphatase 2C domain-containing protein [Sorangium sp. So ce861]|uniref:protein phosphatase 2C domain-containing protein n=1 Tax=Sorangium sp. So ce861 TaxID=3133323 RepID=UPI003F61DD69
MAYDEVLDQVTCPECNASFEMTTQIKFGYCRGHRLRPGDEILWCDARGRRAPLLDLDENLGGELLVPGAGDEACPSCRAVLPNAHVLVRDNVVVRIVLSAASLERAAQLSPPARWFHHWTHRVAASRNEDRLEVFCRGARWTIAVADGAGGIAGGARAASDAVGAAAAFGAEAARTTADWCAFLRDLDRRLAEGRHAGETTLVVVQVAEGAVHGASVGDSRAWMIHEGSPLDLTAAQHRKPLLGTGAAVPVPISPRSLAGRILVATDGLFNYVPAQAIAALASRSPVEQAARALVDRARLPGGGLHDDIALVIGELAG